MKNLNSKSCLNLGQNMASGISLVSVIVERGKAESLSVCLQGE